MKDIDQLIKDIESYYNVKIELNDPVLMWSRGYARCVDNIVVIKNNLSYSMTLKVILHEVGHIHCYRNKIYKNYHTFNSTDEYTSRLKYLTGLRAERYCDRFASHELKKWNYRMKYHFPYSDKILVEGYRTHYLSMFKTATTWQIKLK